MASPKNRSGLLALSDYSCAKDVCPFAVTPSGVVWSSNTHFLSQAHCLPGWDIKLQVHFRAASQVRTAQHCLFVCFHNCSWVWFKTRQFTSLAVFFPNNCRALKKKKSQLCPVNKWKCFETSQPLSLTFVWGRTEQASRTFLYCASARFHYSPRVKQYIPMSHHFIKQE